MMRCFPEGLALLYVGMRILSMTFKRLFPVCSEPFFRCLPFSSQITSNRFGIEYSESLLTMELRRRRNSFGLEGITNCRVSFNMHWTNDIGQDRSSRH